MKQYSEIGSKCALLVVCLVLGVHSGASDVARHEWVFVDTTVAGYQDFVDDLVAGGHDGRQLEVVVLDARRDGIEQIAEALAGAALTPSI